MIKTVTKAIYRFFFWFYGSRRRVCNGRRDVVAGCWFEQEVDHISILKQEAERAKWGEIVTLKALPSGVHPPERLQLLKIS